MKVKFTRDHLDNKSGDEIEVTQEQANYFFSMGLAVDTEDKEAVEKPKRGPKPKDK